MPVYEYSCLECGNRFSRFFWRIADAAEARCRCGSTRLEQLVSRVATIRSEESRLESLADPGRWGDLDENDPKAVAQMMRRLGNEVGEDLGPEFDEAVEELESGSAGTAGGPEESPESSQDNLF
ncbi:MAG: zinc ribbon domain-containing protein [Acidobacteria bacterium]|nr:zinc ribbon domain-containing protein [Acidobacteriota bacterium]